MALFDNMLAELARLLSGLLWYGHVFSWRHSCVAFRLSAEHLWNFFSRYCHLFICISVSVRIISDWRNRVLTPAALLLLAYSCLDLAVSRDKQNQRLIAFAQPKQMAGPFSFSLQNMGGSKYLAKANGLLSSCRSRQKTPRQW